MMLFYNTKSFTKLLFVLVHIHNNDKYLHECRKSTNGEEHSPGVIHKAWSLKTNVIRDCHQCKHCKDKVK